MIWYDIINDNDDDNDMIWYDIINDDNDKSNNIVVDDGI